MIVSISGAYVGTHDQGNKPITMKHIIQRLYPLEIRSVGDSCIELSAKPNKTTLTTKELLREQLQRGS